MSNTYPKLHNAAWPGVVGKGPGKDQEPVIDLDTMLNLTAAAEVNGIKFDGIDLFLFDPHVSIDSTDDDLNKLVDKVRSRGLVIGSVVAPVWGPTGGGSAMDENDGRKNFLTQVRKGCEIAQKLRGLGIRPNGVVRIDSAAGNDGGESLKKWAEDPVIHQLNIADTFRQAAKIAADHGERLAAEGEVCWAGMHSWKTMVDLLQKVGMFETLGFQADMSHILTFLLGINAEEDRLLGVDFSSEQLDEAWKTVSDALRKWTIDFHISQSDGTTHGSGSHDKTGKHCLAKDPNGKLDIVKHAGPWLKGAKDRGIQHICWDGCMFPNETMQKPETWNDILAAMIAVRDEHGWN